MTSATLIAALLDRCDRIRAGIDEIYPYLTPLLPVANDDVSRLTVIERIASVALLKRFEQMQDMLGRLMRALLAGEGYDVQEQTRRDFANTIEKLRLVPNAQDWIDYANLRNRLTHEYPIAETEQVSRVNETWAVVPRLFDIHDAVRAYLSKEGVLP